MRTFLLICMIALSTLSSAEQVVLDTYQYIWQRATDESLKGNHEGAIGLLNIIIPLNKQNSSMYVQRAGEWMRLADYEQAKSDLYQALKIKENSIEAQLAMAVVYTLDGSDAIAADYLKNALDVHVSPPRDRFDNMQKIISLFYYYAVIKDEVKLKAQSKLLSVYKKDHGRMEEWLQKDAVLAPYRDKQWFRVLIKQVADDVVNELQGFTELQKIKWIDVQDILNDIDENEFTLAVAVTPRRIASLLSTIGVKQTPVEIRVADSLVYGEVYRITLPVGLGESLLLGPKVIILCVDNKKKLLRIGMIPRK